MRMVQGKQNDVWKTWKGLCKFQTESQENQLKQEYVTLCKWGYRWSEWVVRLAFLHDGQGW